MSPDLVVSVFARLEQNGLSCLLFGGWAEEAFEMAAPRNHRDIDLLLPAKSFAAVDEMLLEQSAEFTEIVLKRFAHKRAFLVERAMVEIILVQEAQQSAVTHFWGDTPFAWKLPLEEECHLGGQCLRAASRDNLRHFRENHALTQPSRWKDATSLVSQSQFATGR